MPLDPTVEGSEGSTMAHDERAWDGPTAYDMVLMIQQDWVGQEGPLLRVTLRALGEVPRAEYREALERVFANIFEGEELERLFQILIPVGDEAHLGTLTLAVQARRETLAAIAKANEEFEAMMKREFPGFVVIATGRLPERN
jgi:hypothetical protein